MVVAARRIAAATAADYRERANAQRRPACARARRCHHDCCNPSLAPTPHSRYTLSPRLVNNRRSNDRKGRIDDDGRYKQLQLDSNDDDAEGRLSSLLYNEPLIMIVVAVADHNRPRALCKEGASVPIDVYNSQQHSLPSSARPHGSNNSSGSGSSSRRQ